MPAPAIEDIIEAGEKLSSECLNYIQTGTDFTVIDLDHIYVASFYNFGDMQYFLNCVNNYRAIKALHEENKRLRAALEFYADETKYFGIVTEAAMEWPIYRDNGERAREALKDIVPACEHEWIDIRNKIIQSGEACFKCSALRSGNTEKGDA